MKNKTGEPFAAQELTEDGWTIHFSPKPKVDGFYWYSSLTGFIDEEEAEIIVRLLMENKAKFLEGSDDQQQDE